MTVYFHEDDLPLGAVGDGPIAVDTETMGLQLGRDRLCVVQLSDGGGDEHLVRFRAGSDYAAPRLKEVLGDPERLKIYHFARFDLASIYAYLLGHEISKQQQSSDWGAPELSDAQKDYAASDVRYLHALKEKLDERLEREGRVELARACFDFLPHRALLDLAGWAEEDIFAHV
jgi:ribonuclease D